MSTINVCAHFDHDQVEVRTHRGSEKCPRYTAIQLPAGESDVIVFVSNVDELVALQDALDQIRAFLTEHAADHDRTPTAAVGAV